tara:strand:+ start:94 stop:780 length:687 start_codon:yes stop_codon:yes gene_type:complete
MFIKRTLLVFVGPDGSGKTTVIENLKTRLSPHCQIELNHIRFNNIPRAGNLKAFIFSLFNPRIQTLRSRTKSNLIGPDSKYIYGPKFPLWKIIPLLSYEIFDYILGYFTIFRIAFTGSSHQNTLILFDRYLSDFYTEKDWSNTPRWFMNFLLLLAPSPDYIFFMKNSPEKIHSRKYELSIDDIDIVNNRIQSLLCKKTNFVSLDTNNSPDELVEIIMAMLVEKNIDVR